MNDRPTRSFRNNNPGNIDRTRTPWQGEVRSASAMASEPRFCVFETPEYGFRALAKTLQTYQVKHGLKTIEGIIERWAPDNENDTAAYVRAVSSAVGVTPWANINVRSMAIALPLVKAIAHHEAGRDCWPDDVIVRGLKMAGVFG